MRTGTVSFPFLPLCSQYPEQCLAHSKWLLDAWVDAAHCFIGRTSPPPIWASLPSIVQKSRTFPSALPTSQHSVCSPLLLYSTGNFNLTRSVGREVGQVESLMRALTFLQVQTESKSKPFSLRPTAGVTFKKLVRSLGNWMKRKFCLEWHLAGQVTSKEGRAHWDPLSPFSGKRFPGGLEETNCQHSGACWQMSLASKPPVRSWCPLTQYSFQIRCPHPFPEAMGDPSFKQGLKGDLRAGARLMLCPAGTGWSWAHIQGGWPPKPLINKLCTGGEGPTLPGTLTL